MKKIKGIFAGIISVVLILNCMCVFSAEEVESVNSHKHSLEILSALGIVEGDVEAFDESENITRAEYVQYIVKLLGVTETLGISEGSMPFSDVPLAYWAAPYIAYANSVGLISGYQNGEFGPEDWLTYEQAIKIVLAAIGHTEKNTYFTGYPHSYVQFADKLGLLDNVNGSIGAEIKKGDAIELIYNALESEIVIQYGFGSENKYKTDGTTLLEGYWDIKKVEGVFNADEYRNAYGDSLPSAGMIEIDRVAYYVGDLTIDGSLLFKNVTAYVKMDNKTSKGKLVYMEQGDDGECIELLGDYVDSKTDRDAVRYYEGQKLKSARLSENASVLKNGRYYKSVQELNADDLVSAEAEIFMYDNDDDGVFEILNIKKAETFVVDRVDTKNGVIFLKYEMTFNGNNYIELEPQMTDQVITMTKDGQAIDATALKEWNVLDIYQTAGGMLIEIFVTDNQIDGIVTRTSDDGLLIGETVYKMTEAYENAILKGSSDVITPEIGKELTFYLNQKGMIAAVSMSGSGEILYAYMVNAGGEIKNFVSDARVKLFNQEGEMLILNVAEKITLNGKKGVEHNEFLDYIKTTSYGKQCVVKYSINKAGELNYLDTPDENVGSGTSDEENLQFLTTWDGELDWTAGYNLENTRFRLTDKTVIFSLPAEIENDKGYRVIKNSDISVSADHGTPAKFDLYDANEVYRVGAAVYYGGGSGLAAKYTGNLIIVKEVIKILDDEGEVRTQVLGLETVSIRAGEGYTREMTLLEEEPGIFDGLTTGSVFLYKLNADGEVTEIRHDYSPDKNSEFFCTNDDSIQSGGYCYGRVKEISYKDKMILVDAGADGEFSFMLRAVATYDEAEGTVVAAPFEEIKIGDIVYLEGSYSHPGITMIHRYKD